MKITLISLIALLVITVSVYLYVENQDLKGQIKRLQEDLESLETQSQRFESNWAKAANQLTMCRETNWAQESYISGN